MAVKFIFLTSISPNIKIYLPIFKCDNKFFIMFYNKVLKCSLFLVKSIFCINPKKTGEKGQFDCLPPLHCDSFKNFLSREKVKPWFFVNLNIIISHIFPDNFIVIPQVVQKK